MNLQIFFSMLPHVFVLQKYISKKNIQGRNTASMHYLVIFYKENIQNFIELYVSNLICIADIMGSLGGTVARSIESRGIVSGPSVGNLVSSGGGSTGGPSLAALSSAVAATHNTNSLFMANSIQATAATQQRAVSEMLRHMQGLGYVFTFKLVQ